MCVSGVNVACVCGVVHVCAVLEGKAKFVFLPVMIEGDLKAKTDEVHRCRTMVHRSTVKNLAVFCHRKIVRTPSPDN